MATDRGTAPTPGSRRAAWVWLLSGCVVAVGALETTLLALSTGYFTGGFNSVYLDSAAWMAGFLAAAAALDAALVLGLFALVSTSLRWVGIGPLLVYCLAGIAAVLVPGALAVARYNLHVTLGEMVSVSLLSVGSAGSSVGMASIALDEVPPYGPIATGVTGIGILLVVWIARRTESRLGASAGRFAPPSLPALWATFLGASVFAALVLTVASATLDRIRYGLQKKSSGAALTQIVGWASDVDRDGYGLLSKPPDPAPFDARIHPYAIDVPGNGIDENGLGGDHPVGFERAAPSLRSRPVAGRTPHFLLVYLESFRADLLGASFRGREITPFLNRLAAEGASSNHAFVHSPWTVPSRAQLFTGTLVPRPGGETLVDDFHARGYRVAHFSGQDDSFGDSIALVGADRADVFYDARQDVERRTSRTTAAVSLQVSWKTLLERTLALLDSADPAQPLFLYVNFVDTHFPYFHDEIDDLLGVAPLSRREIRSDGVERVLAGYYNTAANVDLAVERLVTAWRARFAGREQAILVTADHGQAFYEKGRLGHGQTLDRAETRVPFILWGIGGDWPEPLGPADLRGQLERTLFLEPGAAGPRARFVAPPQRRILQYIGALERPHGLAWRGLDHVLVMDLRRQRESLWGPDESPVEIGAEIVRAEFLEAVRTWESLQRELLAPTPD